MQEPKLIRRLLAEFMGTAFLVCTVVGSGIMAQRLAGGDAALALLANAIATGAGLAALILMFAPVSGAHFNPAVSLASMLNRELPGSDTAFYVSVQIGGGLLGVAAANVMFDLPVWSVATRVRTGPGQWLGEIIATFGLVGAIIAVSRRHRIPAVALAVAAYIVAGYWFTSSTSFANPAVTIARTLTDTFTGIRPVDALGFVLMQLIAAPTAAIVFNWLVPQHHEN
jgi:glycerol uptake facilitator-like aquaporin